MRQIANVVYRRKLPFGPCCRNGRKVPRRRHSLCILFMSAFGLVEQVAEWLRLRRKGVVSQGAKPPSASRTPNPHRTASGHPVPSPPPAKPPAPGCHRSRRSPAAGCPSGSALRSESFRRTGDRCRRRCWSVRGGTAPASSRPRLGRPCTCRSRRAMAVEGGRGENGCGTRL